MMYVVYVVDNSDHKKLNIAHDWCIIRPQTYNTRYHFMMDNSLGTVVDVVGIVVTVAGLC